MEEFNYNKIKELDHCCSNDSIILLKALALFLPPDKKPEVILLIKFMEINLILQCMKQHSRPYPTAEFTDYEQIFAEIKPSLSKETARQIEQILQMISAFQMYRQMKDLMEVMGPLSEAFTEGQQADSCEHSSDGDQHASGIPSGMGELLKAMIPPEKQQMIDLMFQMNHDTS